MKTTVMLLCLISGGLCAFASGSSQERHSCCAPEDKTVVLPSSSLTEKSLYQLDSNWTNDFGATVKLAALRGRPQVVTMFYANCVYACPLLVYRMQQIEAALPANLRDKVGFTLVSFDTARDTPAVLHDYRSRHSMDSKRWTLLRGGPDAVLELAALLNVRFKQDAQGQFQHSNVITLLNADGEIVFQQVGLNSDCAKMISQASDLARN